ncbi:MAG: hemerythrin domain-containing protein [Myxococcales bacterium]|nr:hemerythrin domain-containing protein [Myxococcales bacterium]MCB9537480.1 hemerythrin domain-containing protein [Myxococcales bacterium]
MSAPTIIEYLEADHVRLRALLDQATAGNALDREAYAAFRGGLLRHIAIEEKLLFPAVQGARDGLRIDRGHALRIDHAALTSLLVPTPDHALCAEIRALLRVHDAKEEDEDGVYAECRRWLSAAQLERLGAEAAGYRQVRMAKHYDGPNVHRTAEDALRSARRMKRKP